MSTVTSSKCEICHTPYRVYFQVSLRINVVNILTIWSGILCVCFHCVKHHQESMAFEGFKSYNLTVNISFCDVCVIFCGYFDGQAIKPNFKHSLFSPRLLTTDRSKAMLLVKFFNIVTWSIWCAVCITCIVYLRWCYHL